VKLEEQLISLELAKKLKELGVPQNSIYHWTAHNSRGGQFRIHRGKLGPFRNSMKYWSAFTVAELGEMLIPRHINVKKIGNIWYVSIFGIDKDFEGSSEADCRGKILIFLLDNKLMEIS